MFCRELRASQGDQDQLEDLENPQVSLLTDKIHTYMIRTLLLHKITAHFKMEKHDSQTQWFSSSFAIN